MREMGRVECVQKGAGLLMKWHREGETALWPVPRGLWRRYFRSEYYLYMEPTERESSKEV
jgi:hypothetical protein